MLRTTIVNIRKGDRIAFRDGGKPYTVTNVQPHSFEPSLRMIEFAEMPLSAMPLDAVVLGVEMYRVITVPCLVCRKSFRVLHNMASGATLRGVLCEDCDDRATQEVLREMSKLKEAKEKDADD